MMTPNEVDIELVMMKDMTANARTLEAISIARHCVGAHGYLFKELSKMIEECAKEIKELTAEGENETLSVTAKVERSTRITEVNTKINLLGKFIYMTEDAFGASSGRREDGAGSIQMRSEKERAMS